MPRSSSPRRRALGRGSRLDAVAGLRDCARATAWAAAARSAPRPAWQGAADWREFRGHGPVGSTSIPPTTRPGCTVEGREFRDLHEAFACAEMHGRRRQCLFSRTHRAFAEKHAFPFALAGRPRAGRTRRAPLACSVTGVAARSLLSWLTRDQTCSPEPSTTSHRVAMRSACSTSFGAVESHRMLVKAMAELRPRRGSTGPGKSMVILCASVIDTDNNNSNHERTIRHAPVGSE